MLSCGKENLFKYFPFFLSFGVLCKGVTTAIWQNIWQVANNTCYSVLIVQKKLIKVNLKAFMCSSDHHHRDVINKCRYDVRVSWKRPYTSCNSKRFQWILFLKNNLTTEHMAMKFDALCSLKIWTIPFIGLTSVFYDPLCL